MTQPEPTTELTSQLTDQLTRAIAGILPAGSKVAVAVVAVSIPQDDALARVCLDESGAGELLQVAQVRPLTTAEAAKVAGVAQNTVAGWCRDGDIDAVKVRGSWRVPLDALRAHMRHANTPEAPRPRLVSDDGERGRYRVPDSVIDDHYADAA